MEEQTEKPELKSKREVRKRNRSVDRNIADSYDSPEKRRARVRRTQRSSSRATREHNEDN